MRGPSTFHTGGRMIVSQTTRRIGAAALAAVGAIHLVLAPEYAGERLYIGVLFVLGGVALLFLAARLWRTHDVPAWLLGALTMAAMGAGFVLSRTVGLPAFHESEWEPSGVVSLVLEGGFVVTAAIALRGVGPAEHRRDRLAA